MAIVEIKTSDLTGLAMDWIMAKIEGFPVIRDPMGFKSGSEAGYWVWDDDPNGVKTKIGRGYSPSTHWNQLGPLIVKYLGGDQLLVDDDLPINSMRAIISKMLGETVHVPSDLLREIQR